MEIRRGVKEASRKEKKGEGANVQGRRGSKRQGRRGKKAGKMKKKLAEKK